jgi:hypothetical protein
MMSDDQFVDKYNGCLEELLAADEDEDFPQNYPVSHAQLAHAQKKDKALNAAFDKSDLCKKVTFNHADKTHVLICRDGKIVVPKALQHKTVDWYHTTCQHPGETRTELTIAQHFYWTGMRKTIVNYCKRCKTCQITKKEKQKFGHLPPKDPETIPWHTLCIDLIGPYTIGKVKKRKVKGQTITDDSNVTTLWAMTMIDPATGWFEIATIPTKRADWISNILEQTWLNRYPYPTEIVMDRGSEFQAEVGKMLKDEYGITRKPITTRNPQANAIVERVHQTIGNQIRSLQINNKEGLEKYGDWDGVLGAVAKGVRSTVHTTLQATPTQLVFGRDAILNIGFQADWEYIKQRKQKLIIQNNKRENAKRVPHQYNVGDKVKVLQNPNTKFGEDRYKGPFEINQVYDNGTVKLKQDTPAGGVVYTTWNIRNVSPYRD